MDIHIRMDILRKNNMLSKIGIIGFGFLGRALAHGFSLHADIKIYDKYDNYCFYKCLQIIRQTTSPVASRWPS